MMVVKETYLEQVRAAGDSHQLSEIADKKPGLESVQESHEQHERCIEIVTSTLARAGVTLDTIHRNTEGLKSHLEAGGVDLIVTVGGDGTFLRASHEVGSDIPVLGVNSAPLTSFGHYCCTDGPGFPALFHRILSGSFQPTHILRLNLSIDGQAIAEPVLNEVLVAHKHPAGTSRYQLEVDGVATQHKCSGLIVAAPPGSTGFLRSEGGTVLPITARKFTFVERAPFLKIDERPALNSGVLDADRSMVMISQMQDGKLFIDGDHIEYDFPRGAKLTITAGASDLLAYVDPDCHAPFIKPSITASLPTARPGRLKAAWQALFRS